LTETFRGLGAAKHSERIHFRGAGAFCDEVSLTGRYFTADEAPGGESDQPGRTLGHVLEAARMLAMGVAANPPLVCVRNWSVRATVRVTADSWIVTRRRGCVPAGADAAGSDRGSPRGSLVFKEKRRRVAAKGGSKAARTVRAAHSTTTTGPDCAGPGQQRRPEEALVCSSGWVLAGSLKSQPRAPGLRPGLRPGFFGGGTTVRLRPRPIFLASVDRVSA
jgi:hypothetical protein